MPPAWCTLQYNSDMSKLPQHGLSENCCASTTVKEKEEPWGSQNSVQTWTWRTTDSAGATSTSNLTRRVAQHRIFPHTSESTQDLDDVTAERPALLSNNARKGPWSEILWSKWLKIVMSHPTPYNYSSFQRIFQGLGLPYSSRLTITR
jgi:hypothetical protein